MKPIAFFLLILVFFAYSCNQNGDKNNSQSGNFKYIDSVRIVGEENFLTGYLPRFNDGEINAVIEIPSGSVEKWEVNAQTGEMEWIHDLGVPRKVSYMAYPGNYGFVPQTLLPVEDGFDGDPLDVIILGTAVERGSVIKCKLIGVMKMIDSKQPDDKLIAVRSGTPFYDINSIIDLNEQFNGITYILQTWFTNYKGDGIVEITGFGEKDEAVELLVKAINSFKANQ